MANKMNTASRKEQ